MSGGGETGSLVMGTKPELYAAYLFTVSKWDGDLEVLAAARTPGYLAIGEEDSYYGSGPLKSAYAELCGIYEEQGLTEDEIDRLAVLDVRPGSYFTDRGYRDQHAGGQAFAHDEQVMGWVFRQGGGSNETTTMGTSDSPHPFKHIMDHAIGTVRRPPAGLSQCHRPDFGPQFGWLVPVPGLDQRQQLLVRHNAPLLLVVWSTAPPAAPVHLSFFAAHRYEWPQADVAPVQDSVGRLGVQLPIQQHIGNAVDRPPYLPGAGHLQPLGHCITPYRPR